MSLSKIEWTDRTWNPVRGCSRVSEGCRNCYAERLASRFAAGPLPNAFHGFAGMNAGEPRWTGRVELIPEKLNEPIGWRKPSRVFVNSMSDLFHEKLPVEAIAQVFNVMASATPDCGKRHVHFDECWGGESHTFQILTKRPEQMRKMLAEDLPHFLDNYVPGDWAVNVSRDVGQWPLPNVWLGVSVEDQATADERIPLLLQTPAAVRFVSYEPALGPVDFSRWLLPLHLEGLRGCYGFHWLIVGGESGPGARAFNIAWAWSAVAQCKVAGVPVFVKQLGARPYAGMKPWAPYSPGCDACEHADPHHHIGKHGNPDEWPEDLRVREFPR